MKKQKRKNLNRILLISAVLVLIFIVFFLSTKQTVVQIRTYENTQILPLETGNFNLGQYSGTYETVKIGQVSCSGNPGTYYCQLAKDVYVDESSSFSNSLSDGEELVISSSVSGDGGDFENYIKTKITLPKGKLKINYNYGISTEYTKASPEYGLLTLNIDNYTISPVVPDHSTGTSGSNTIEINLEKEREVEFSIYTTVASSISTSSQGSLTVSFEPEEIPEQTQTYYRFSNNDCSQINILPSEKTSNDYSTLTECESNIITTEPIPGDTNDGITENSKVNIIGIFIILTILILLIIIIRNLIKRKRK